MPFELFHFYILSFFNLSQIITVVSTQWELFITNIITNVGHLLSWSSNVYNIEGLALNFKENVITTLVDLKNEIPHISLPLAPLSAVTSIIFQCAYLMQVHFDVTVYRLCSLQGQCLSNSVLLSLL